MATHAPNTGAPTCAPGFKLNGVSLLIDEPYPYLDQAHALSCALSDAVMGGHKLNDELLESAIRGITTLIELASHGLQAMDLKQEGR